MWYYTQRKLKKMYVDNSNRAMANSFFLAQIANHKRNSTINNLIHILIDLSTYTLERFLEILHKQKLHRRFNLDPTFDRSQLIIIIVTRCAFIWTDLTS